MCKFKIDKIAYFKPQSRVTYNVIKNKPSVYPLLISDKSYIS